MSRLIRLFQDFPVPSTYIPGEDKPHIHELRRRGEGIFLVGLYLLYSPNYSIPLDLGRMCTTEHAVLCNYDI